MPNSRSFELLSSYSCAFQPSFSAQSPAVFNPAVMRFHRHDSPIR